MANIQSQIKRNRQNEKRRLRNRDFRGAARTAVKDALSSMSSGEKSPEAVMAAVSALDKAAAKGAIHHRNAARRKGRLMKHLAAMGMQPSSGAEVRAADESAKARPAQARSASKTAKAPASAEPKTKSEPKKSAAKKTAAKKTAQK